MIQYLMYGTERNLLDAGSCSHFPFYTILTLHTHHGVVTVQSCA